LLTALLALQAALAIAGAQATSVTFDESFHVPAGVAYVATGDAGVSAVNPPLAKALFGLAALSAGAKLPEAAVLATHDSRAVNEAFIRANVVRYRGIFFAARMTNIALALALGFLVWGAARARFGSAGGLLAVALWALTPEALAHGGVATLDIATALLWLAGTLTAARVVRTGSWRDTAALAVVAAAFALTRFTAVLLLPLALVLWLVERVRGRAAPLRLAWRPWLLAPLAMLAALWLGYGIRAPAPPLREWTFASRRFQALQRSAPSLRLPLPRDVVTGLDHQSVDAEPGHLTTYVLGRATTTSVWWYFPFAVAVKWPLGLLAALLLVAGRAIARRRIESSELIVSTLVFLIPAMTFGNLDAGVRYVLPLLPLACVGAGSLASARPRAGTWRTAAVLCVAAVAIETWMAAPWWLSHFNPLAGPPERRERWLNDSNVDWGQGLVALKAEMQRRGIARIHLTYLGTTDPHLYGIDFEPYWTGVPGPASDWLAVSSYFYVGLPQTLRLKDGPSPGIAALDFHVLPPERAAARPGDCMWLFKIR
jgi:4-amino-4-deoxy-L-arabinose transferase-like glycosyltransferase